jgi:hypothetical protein
MKKILLLATALLCAQTFFAQSSLDLPPCGTSAMSQQELRGLTATARSGGDTVLYVPLTIQNFSNDGAATFFGTGRILDALTRLNLDYATSKIQFYVEGPMLKKRSTLWNNHKTVVEGADMMFKNNIANTINIYINSNAAGNCGYNLPYAGISLSKSCMGANDHTWAHELGHNLSLPHTFLGWEGNTYSASKPTPRRVTYDYTLFKDSLITGKTIIDTAFVELVNGSNCAIAADLFCDTKPDYTAARWACDANKQSLTTFKDPNGQTFKADGSLFMSYANSECMSRFSELEMAKMRSVLLGKKKFLLYNQVPKPVVDTKATTLYSPLDNAQISAQGVLFKWDKIQNAEQYVIQISRSGSFSSLDYDIVTDKTEYVLDMVANRTYYAQVRAFNSHSTATPWTKSITFKTLESTSAVSDESMFNSFAIFPNPLNNSELLQVIANVNEDFKSEITLTSITGQILFSQKRNLLQGENRFEIPFILPKGIHLLSVVSEKGKIVRKIVSGL